MLILTRLTKPKGNDRLAASKITKLVNTCHKEKWSCNKLRDEVRKALPSHPRPLVWIKKLRSGCDLLVTLLDGSTGIFEDESITRIKSKDVAAAVKQADSLDDKLALLKEQIVKCRKSLSNAKKELAKRDGKSKHRSSKSKPK